MNPAFLPFPLRLCGRIAPDLAPFRAILVYPHAVRYCIVEMERGRNAKSDAMNDRKIGDTGIFYPEWFWEQNFRFGDIMILVGKGKAEEVAREVYRRYKTVLMTSWRINTVANLVVQAYYTDSNMLKDIIEGIKAIDNVERVEFSEYVNIVNRRSYEEVIKDIRQFSKS
jgi:hypothetical protein